MRPLLAFIAIVLGSLLCGVANAYPVLDLKVRIFGNL
jgi:hypothetical protein